ncbi:rhodanese-like domain-containing protein [Planococcus shixiaomingii]|uniref:rhodanese-like domain-containing protein n=1 Tax=Planococcus shixiaomingii TaxID=3058393 RepID=UPI00260433EC|nr:rhodanese-like domain-containing protein [Planococcus sp. N022]WKA54534.1 rhodanese-like domain-containing protein [Planococcus sp. N022]
MKTMTTKEVQEMLENKQAVSLIDVRETEEVAAGKIPRAVNIPLSLLEFRLQDIDKSKEHTIVCRSGNRSAQATRFLESRGFNVINMAGGMLDWNGPIE